MAGFSPFVLVEAVRRRFLGDSFLLVLQICASSACFFIAPFFCSPLFRFTFIISHMLTCGAAGALQNVSFSDYVLQMDLTLFAERKCYSECLCSGAGIQRQQVVKCLSALRQLAALRELPAAEGSRSVRISVMDPGVRADIEALFPFI